ncbi:MAG TPA: restriction endonuclease [Symbiobacteriaceae bacterium]
MAYQLLAYGCLGVFVFILFFFLIFFSAISWEDSPAASVALIGAAVYTVCMYIGGWVERVKQRKTIQAIMPEVSKFVALWIPDGTWPTTPSIPDDEISALHTILTEEGHNLPLGVLTRLVEQETKRQVAERFGASFEQAVGWTSGRPDPLTVDTLAEAYVKCFENNRTHLTSLLEYARMHGLNSSLDELRQAVERAIKKQAHEQNVAELKQKLKSGTWVSMVRAEHQQPIQAMGPLSGIGEWEYQRGVAELKERLKAAKEEEEKTIQAILPEVSKFVALWIPDGARSEVSEIPDAHISELRTVLAEKGYNLPLHVLKQVIREEEKRQVAERFAASFEQAVGWTSGRPDPLTVDTLAEAYVQCFENSRRHVPELLEYAHLRGLNCTLNELQLAVELAIEKRQQKTIQAILPEVSRFVALWIPDGTWPTTPSIPDDEISALHTILAEEGHNLPLEVLKRVVEQESKRQVAERFAASFEQAVGWTSGRPDPLTVDTLAEAYVQCFENSIMHLPALLEYTHMRGLNCTLNELHRAIERAIDKRIHERKVAELRQKLALGTKASPSRITLEQIDVMTGSEFEQFLGKLFSAMGYETVITKATGDQGADLVLTKFGETTVVQAKRYSQPVGNKAVQEIVAAKALYNAQHAIVVTNSTFTPAALDLAASNKVELWDRHRLAELIRQYF